MPADYAQCGPDQPENKDSIESTLAKLNKMLSDTKVNDKLLAERIKDISKRADDVKQIVSSYKKVAKELKKKCGPLIDYQSGQQKAIIAVVEKANRDAVTEIVRAYQAETNKINDPNKLREDLIELESKLSVAKRNYDEAVAEFTKLQEFQKKIEEAIKRLEALKADNEKAEAEGKEELMYFLIAHLFVEELSVEYYSTESMSYSLMKLIDEGEIERLAENRWRNVNNMAEALQQAQAAVDSQKAQIASSEQRLKDRAKERRAEITSDIAEMFPPINE